MTSDRRQGMVPEHPGWQPIFRLTYHLFEALPCGKATTASPKRLGNCVPA